ncbi:neprilysin-4-like [Cylas formicarius]|uniref:neprilysin-4-like n=1 Tax=Cylas formicarius TaxID=197179 RepID=UPI0029586D3B|nr:neprilysin-4-like [Cylas formicarius]
MIVSGTLLVVVFSYFVIAEAANQDLDDDGGIEFDEIDSMNLTVDPCDDFYEFACGNFSNLHEIPENQLNVDQFSLLQDSLTKLASAILSMEDESDDPDALRKARTAYKTCMDERLMDSDSLLSPEVQIVNEYGGFPLVGYGSEPADSFGWYQIADLAADYGIPLLFSVTTTNDAVNASNNVLRIDNDKMDLPSQIRSNVETYDDIISRGFFELSKRSRNTDATLSPFELFLRRVALKLNKVFGRAASDASIFEKVANISNFLVGIYYPEQIPRDVEIEPLDQDSNPITLEKLNAWTQRHFGDSVQLDWVEYVRRLFKYTNVEITKDTEVMIYTNTNVTLYGVLQWVKMNDPEIVKSAALLRVFVYMAADSDQETRADFENYLRTISKTVYPRWEYCTRKIADYDSGTVSLSLALTYEYQLRYFNVNKLQLALQMIRDIQKSFNEVINDADWMDETSKSAAIEKAGNIVTLLGYPDFLMNKTAVDSFYQNLKICSWDNYGNSKRLRAFKYAYQLNLFSQRSRTSWEKSPFDVNAYYNRANNRIIFPVAVLNPVFFGGSVSLLDYSRIGSIIGHEITHGFDQQGMMFDKNGNLNIWATTETMTNFAQQSQCFQNQYSEYPIPEIGSTVNGVTTLNENIADNGGTRTSYKALKKMIERTTQNGELVPRTDKFTWEQLFFIGYGTMWCNRESTAYLTAAQTCTSNCHARSKWRVNGVVSNMEEFASAFNCLVGSKMNPENKCKLW